MATTITSAPIKLTDAKTITDAGVRSSNAATSALGHQVQDCYQALSKNPSRENANSYLQNLLGLANNLKGNLDQNDLSSLQAAAKVALKGANLPESEIESLIPSKDASRSRQG